MKSILISIKPQFVEKILSGEKTIEIRKSQPISLLREIKDFDNFLGLENETASNGIDVYIYCTKDKGNEISLWSITNKQKAYQPDDPMLNGKVVAKFTLRKVEPIIPLLLNPLTSYGEDVDTDMSYFVMGVNKYIDEILERSCLSRAEFNDYGYNKRWEDEDVSQLKTLYAWHISDLQIFEMALSLSNFGISKAPQSYRYIEVKK